MISMSYLQPFENVLHSGKLPTPTSTAASTAVSHSKEIKGNSNSPDSLIKLLHFCELLNQEQIPKLCEKLLMTNSGPSRNSAHVTH